VSFFFVYKSYGLKRSLFLERVSSTFFILSSAPWLFFSSVGVVCNHYRLHVDPASMVQRSRLPCHYFHLPKCTSRCFTSKRAKVVATLIWIYDFKRACPLYVIVCVDLYCHNFYYLMFYSQIYRLLYEKMNTKILGKSKMMKW
jgi:hypothetical protein